MNFETSVKPSALSILRVSMRQHGVLAQLICTLSLTLELFARLPAGSTFGCQLKQPRCHFHQFGILFPVIEDRIAPVTEKQEWVNLLLKPALFKMYNDIRHIDDSYRHYGLPRKVVKA